MTETSIVVAAAALFATVAGGMIAAHEMELLRQAFAALTTSMAEIR